ncbi:hypothetical protein [Pseudokineococcus lusitanus]|uniref:Heme peroxidase n=1 Tax=Pseudokineococcus lusitanus TaxID=763993 RepID=A0A3N1GWF7_9ACTN|nr:hypothetical protein [Pseudokineococcus lusitanus]ROP34569.1 hypothetical protein EDC03_2384 [Pseudokineococcus lusitanus]
MTHDDDVARLSAHVEETLPRDEWAGWPGGWRGQSELALLDAVFSISARYGGEDTGVRRVVKAYRDRPGATGADDLRTLAAFDAEELAALVGNRQRVSGRLKADAVVEAAAHLVAAGATSSDNVDPTAHKSAYTSVHGLGSQTWHYFCMLLGREEVKADRWIIRFVEDALGRPSTADESHRLLHAVAERLGASPTALDHAIWSATREPAGNADTTGGPDMATREDGA